jgi:hypothetical protein
MNDKWAAQWKVKSSSGSGIYTVSQDYHGKYACSCPAWTRNMPRKDCKHIAEVRNNRASKFFSLPGKKAKYVLAMVNKPTYIKSTNTLKIPLIRLPDTKMMEASIVYMMAKHGWTWSQIKEQRVHLPKAWNLMAVIDFVEQHGLAEYPPEKRRK